MKTMALTSRYHRSP